MASDSASPLLPDALVRRVLTRLGLQAPPAPDLDGLRAVYRGWCAHAPFDNVRKMIAVRSGSRNALPGGHAADFLQAWLAHGTGGTCWPSSNALFEVLRALGFAARRATGAMRDLGLTNHGTVIVTIDGDQWLADSSILCNEPLPLDAAGFALPDPALPVEVEPNQQSHVVWFAGPPLAVHMPCRIFYDSVPHEFYLARYEDSRARSPFNQRLFARRNRAGGVVALIGNTRFLRTAAGLETADLSPGQLCEALLTDIGLSREVIERWRRSGSLAASFEPRSGPPSPPITGLPPSRRAPAAGLL